LVLVNVFKPIANQGKSWFDRRMGKGHYPGGGSLRGEGPIVKAKGRRSGLGPSGSALRAQQRLNDKKRKERIAKQVDKNQQIMYHLKKLWENELKQRSDEKINVTKQVNSSSLAAALSEAFDRTKPKQ
jgi:hypothetical protein